MSRSIAVPPPFPLSRPRRLRRDAQTRALVREHRLAPEDLILPVFVLDGKGRTEDVASMPGVQRMSLDRLIPVAEDCVALGIPALALFPVIDPALKTPDGREALNPDGLVPRVVQALKDRCPQLAVPSAAVVKGDSKVPAIAAASILAKVSRDREMQALDRQYPGYGIAGHKGYPTAVHLEALQRLGPTPVHRRSFGPVRRLLEQS